MPSTSTGSSPTKDSSVEQPWKGGNPVQKLEVKASLNNGALHVWVDGQEIKPVAVKIEGV